MTRSLKVTANGLTFGAPKNQASHRSVPLNKSVVSAMRAHRLRQNEERLSAPEWHDHDLVFPNRVGRPTDHNNLYYREFKPLLKKAGSEIRASPFIAYVIRSPQLSSNGGSIQRLSNLY